MSFDLNKEEVEELEFHPPATKEEEREMERRRVTKEGVRDLIKRMTEGDEGRVLWGEVKNVLFNEKELFKQYIDTYKRVRPGKD